MASSDQAVVYPRSPKRNARRDPRLPIADLFDPAVAEQMWQSLPDECRVDHFGKNDVPSLYRGAVRREITGSLPARAETPRFTTCYLNFRGLPQPMIWELAWLVHREVELGRFIFPSVYNATTRLLRAATTHGSKRGRVAPTLLALSPEEWIREAQIARMNGSDLGPSNDRHALARLREFHDLLVYPYHRGAWSELDVWNPLLDRRIPQRPHEPHGRNIVNFSHLTSEWLREGAKLWLAANLSSGTMTWSTVKTRLNNLKWFQRYIDRYGDHGPLLTAEPQQLRPFIRGFCDMLLAYRITGNGPSAGQPLKKNPRRQIMVTIERFFQWMYDHREEGAEAHKDWASLRTEHTALFRPDDKPRLTNKKSSEDMILEDSVVERIAEGSELLARPKEDGGFGDIQAFHALMLLIRTGRRINEVLMMDFDPLIPLQNRRRRNLDEDGTGFVARMHYQQTKVDAGQRNSIPIDAELVAIIRSQQNVARQLMIDMGATADTTPRYLFLGRRTNRNGIAPYPRVTLHQTLKRLADRLDIKDSVGRRVAISKTHRFRHTAATNLINAGVPLHVVMRYFGHVTPEMTLHYAVTRDQTMEEEFLKFKKVKRDGRTVDVEASDLYELIQLDKRADRVLPNGWCVLPPKLLCDKGNACISCDKFVTDVTHSAELRRQLESTESLVRIRQEAFVTKYGSPMGDENIWLQGRREEIASLNRILLSITDITDRAVRGAGSAQRPTDQKDA